MRLICPNCDAEYEVPDSAIPAEGRDVQCSNCGVTWFFDPSAPLEADVEMAEDLADPDPAPAAIEPDPQPEPAPAPVAPAPKMPQVTAPVIDPEEGFEATPPPPPNAPEPKRRELDNSVKDVLRQEAEFEARARAEDQSVEVQPDLGLAPPPKPAPNAAEDADVDDVAGGAAPRRDLLPDIEEINSTLRASSDRGDGVNYAEVAAQEDARKRGFRSGFGLSLIILGGLAALYAYAPNVVEMVPGLEAPLGSFVDTVNTARAWLQDLVSSAVAKMG